MFNINTGKMRKINITNININSILNNSEISDKELIFK